MKERVVEVQTSPGHVEVRPKLPIFEKRDEFIQRLRDEKVLVVTAETGSGKTTQLPQYCAESFQKLVVCTQPRVLAALSIATRIADEYDGTSVGHNVGCSAKGSKTNRGRRIMLMTDAALVRMAQSDRTLSQIGVLIVDEAHERSLNTDIVLGIAKSILEKRPGDFHVVIASATIDPTRFLEFFFPTEAERRRGALKVPGRTFPVHLAPPVIPADRHVDVLKELLVNTVVSSLQQHPDGHCLVFLPGSSEIDKAIKQFRQHEEYELEWETFPLYGGMPPEEQQRIFEYPSDGLNGSKRMIIFCTNVAETSLTVPNVRLVIDTGLAKEARFDPQRRMTVLEQVMVSKSSAKQRMGRAGRMCEGTCVQLFDHAALERENIEPEILRSSLDMVVLQLCKLGAGFEPLRFPFLDRPSEANLRSSLEMLCELGCLGQGGAITALGNLFNDLPFDPRLSRFVMDMHEAGYQELGVEIAAVMSAPGSVHFMGGSDKSAKQEKQRKIAAATAESESDLLYLHGVYDTWKRAGTVTDGVCSSCGGKAKAQGCSRCRASVARNDGLNNKVCEAVLRTCMDVATSLDLYFSKITPSQPPVPPPTSTPCDAIARALVSNFREQVCEILLATNPDLGAYIVGSGMKGIFSEQSCVANNRALTGTHALAMSVMQTPSGNLVLSNCHPLKDAALPAHLRQLVSSLSINLVKCFERANLHSRFRAVVQRFVETSMGPLLSAEGADLGRFVVCAHDRADNKLTVYAPNALAAQVAAKVKGALEAALQSDLDYSTTVVISSGSAQVTVSSGLQVTRVDTVSVRPRVKITAIPAEVDSDKSLRLWLSSKAGVKDDDVAWLKFNPADPTDEQRRPATATVMFKSEEVAETVRLRLGHAESLDTHKGNDAPAPQRQVAEQDFSTEDSWGRLVTAQLDSYVGSYEELLLRYPFLPVAAKSEVHHSKVQFSVTLKNLHPQASEEFVRRQLLAGVDPTTYTVALQTAKQLHVKKYGIYGDNPSRFTKEDYSARMGFCNFTSQAAASAAVAAVHRSLAEGRCPPMNVSGQLVRVEVSYTPPKEAKTFLDVYFATPESATAAVLALQRIGCHAAGKAVLSIEHPDLYDLQALLTHDERDRGVTIKHEVKPDKRSGGKRCVVEFAGSDPVACGRAAQRMKTRVDPIVLRLSDRQQQKLFTELVSTGQLGEWAAELGLKEKVARFRPRNGSKLAQHQSMDEQLVMGVTIYGPGTKKGELMRRIADSSNEFVSRYKLVPLGREAALFRQNRAGSVQLEALDRKLGDDCRLQFVVPIQSIEVQLQPGCALSLSDVVPHVDALLTSLGACGKQKRALQESVACVYCEESCSSSFAICGHHCCRSCFSVAVEGADSFPVCCPVTTCRTPLSVHDMTSMLNRDTLAKVCVRSARTSLKQQRQQALTFCPNRACDAVLLRASGYGACPSCRQDVCTKCGAMNATHHKNMSCEDFDSVMESLEKGPKAGIDHLLSASRLFLQDNWSPTLGTISDVAINPALLSGAPSFQKYLQGAVSMGEPNTVMSSKGLFAWHGTKNDDAVIGICHHGFDPKRRSGQAYGPGEYFGHTADISHGYAGSSSRMLVCHLLRSPAFSTHGNFCYVLNNPLDASRLFCIVVLVVTYGNRVPRLPPIQFVPFKPAPSQQAQWLSGVDASDSDSEDSAPEACAFRWKWQQDDGTFHAYTDAISAEIELAYSKYQVGSLQEVTIGPLVRFVDDAPQSYRINFRRMQQVNVKTQYSRGVRRELQQDVGLSGAVVWEYCNEHSRWTPIDTLCQTALETHYQAYLAGSAPAQLANLQYPGRPERYTVCFLQPMTQTNLQTQARRTLRRVNRSERHARGDLYGESVGINLRFPSSLRVTMREVLTKLRGETEQIVKAALGANADEWDLPSLEMQPLVTGKCRLEWTASIFSLLITVVCT
jgi:pre-mRNA-splicing factor ATP-dependent RNA helicase DHX15/PRP43